MTWPSASNRAQTWSDLILPPAETATLHTIVAQVRQRAKVYDDWGFAAKAAVGWA
jgi:hypothetical protein